MQKNELGRYDAGVRDSVRHDENEALLNALDALEPALEIYFD